MTSPHFPEASAVFGESNGRFHWVIGMREGVAAIFPVLFLYPELFPPFDFSIPGIDPRSRFHV
jgi:hypothetical protein